MFCSVVEDQGYEPLRHRFAEKLPVRSTNWLVYEVDGYVKAAVWREYALALARHSERPLFSLSGPVG